MLNQRSVTTLDQLSKFTNWANNDIDRFPQTPGSYQFLSSAEQDRSHSYKEFTYSINEIGCRSSLELQKSIAFFGCSFTFGEGVAEEDTFSDIIANKLNMPYNNLGSNGYTIPQIAQLFHATLQVLNFDTAIITLPSPFRFHYVTTKDKCWPVYPNKDRDDAEHETIRKKVYANLSENYLLHQAKDYITYIQACADLYNKKVIWGTWSKDTYALLENLEIDTIKFNFEYVESLNLQGDYIARDNIHPGIIQHAEYSRNILDAIK